MTQKKLQKGSRYESFDLNKDGMVDDEEIRLAREIKEYEDKARKLLAQRRMATYTLIFMGLYATILLTPIIDLERLKELSSVSDLLFISGSSIVGFYMGSSAYMSRNGNGK
tara:strand:- start:198 stop:530 length:333 start_codon:yes stop_codon:yes gene_type:complete